MPQPRGDSIGARRPSREEPKARTEGAASRPRAAPPDATLLLLAFALRSARSPRSPLGEDGRTPAAPAEGSRRFLPAGLAPLAFLQGEQRKSSRGSRASQSAVGAAEPPRKPFEGGQDLYLEPDARRERDEVSLHQKPRGRGRIGDAELAVVLLAAAHHFSPGLGLVIDGTVEDEEESSGSKDTVSFSDRVPDPPGVMERAVRHHQIELRVLEGKVFHLGEGAGEPVKMSDPRPRVTRNRAETVFFV